MRLNFEDNDFKFQGFGRFIRGLERLQIHPDFARPMAVGFLGLLWYNAVNLQEKNPSLIDIDGWWYTFDVAKTEQIINLLIDCQYLKKNDNGTYAILLKDKDFSAKINYSEGSTKGNQAKKAGSHRIPPDPARSGKKRRKSDRIPPDPAGSGPHSITDHSNTYQYNPDPDQEKPPSVGLTVIETGMVELGIRTFDPIYQIKEEYEWLYRQNMNGGNPTEWTLKDTARAKIAVQKLKTVEKVIEHLAFYFVWNNQRVIDAGYPFSDGYLSFVESITQLKADILNPERRLKSKIADDRMKSNIKKVSDEEKRKQIIADAMKAHEESKGFL